jgi:hypothetical protein
MTAKINYIIPQQRFETIRDAIALILKEELAKQKALTTNILFDAGVFIERFVTFDHTECPAINVIYDETLFSNKDNFNNTGEMQFFIDIISVAQDSTTKRGDQLSSENLHKLMGVIRYILDSMEYRLLNLDAGIVQSKKVVRMRALSPDNTYNVSVSNDSLNSISGRIYFNVRASEAVSFSETITVTEIHSTFTIEDSGLGYKIVVNNN